MEAPETTKVIFRKVMELEPEYATKIIGYIIFQDHGEQDMIRLAFASDNMIKFVIEKAKQALKLSPITNTSNHNLSLKDKQPVVSKLPTKLSPFAPSSSRYPTSPQVNNSQIENCTPTYQQTINNVENVPFSYFSSPINGFSFHKPHFSPLEGWVDHGSHSRSAPELEWDPKPNKSQVLREMKFCDRFNQGLCKFGVQCRFLHCMRLTDDFIMIANPPTASDVIKEYHVLSHGSVKKLERELIEILKSKGLVPVPLSTLPDLYRERYGRKLAVIGYYTENYMQGKIVCDLNQLLIHLTNNIRMIQRNGEICVILAQNIQMYLKYNDEQDQCLTKSPPACQVYVTFRPDSTFTRKDFIDYFNNYGPVKSVRFPYQLQRMFGFVTFVYPVTVTVVLSKVNPHFICGNRLLVKPYQANNRRSNRNLRQPVRSLRDDESKNLSITAPGPSGNISLPNKQVIIEEHDLSVDKNSIPSSSHNSNKAIAGSSAPRGVCNKCAPKGKGVMIRDYQEDRFEELNLPENPFAL